MMTYYRGPPVVMTHLDSSHQLLLQLSSWVTGGFLLAIDALSASAWVIVQVNFLKKNYAEVWLLYNICLILKSSISGTDPEEIPR